MSEGHEAELEQDEVHDLLDECVDNIYDVQTNHDDLTEEQAEMLEDAKSSIAAVSMELAGVELRL